MFIISKQSIIFVIISATSSTEILKCTPLSLILGKLNFFIASYIHGHTYKETDSFAERVDFQFRTPPIVKGYFVLQSNTQRVFCRTLPSGILQNTSQWKAFCETPLSVFCRAPPGMNGYFVDYFPVTNSDCEMGTFQKTSQWLKSGLFCRTPLSN